MFGGDITDNFITKWDGFVDKIIAVGKKVAPSIAVMIDSFEEADSSKWQLYTVSFSTLRPQYYTLLYLSHFRLKFDI